jgi:Protein of unknown function (DUF4240)
LRADHQKYFFLFKSRIFAKKSPMTTMIKIPLRNLTGAVVQDLQEKYPDAELQIDVAGDKPSGLLTEQRFWELIGLLDWSKQGDDEAVIEPAVTALANGPTRHIFDFEDIVSKKLYLLDGLKYAQQIGESAYRPNRYFSVDTFLYARCCVVANGKDFYERVLKNPALMPKNIDFEALLSIASEAYERQSGKELDYIPAYPIETYSNRDAWKDADFIN